MYVSRGDVVMFQANADGAIMENATVRTRLKVGGHLIEEDFEDSAGNVYAGEFWS